MSGQLWGQDIEQVRLLAQIFERSAQELESARQLTDHAVMGFDGWGPNVDHLRETWSASLAPSLTQVADALRAAGETAAANADAQEGTSDSSGVSAGAFAGTSAAASAEAAGAGDDGGGLTDWFGDRLDDVTGWVDDRASDFGDWLSGDGGDGRNNTSPWELGLQWLTGIGPREQHFTDGDPLTEMYKEHEHTQEAINFFDDMTRSGDYELGHEYQWDYQLGGLDGPLKYARDLGTLATLGLTGNLAYTYLGSHDVSMTPIRENPDGSVVWQYVVKNDSDIESATHPPVIGYTPWWTENVGDPIMDLVGKDGPLSPTSQTIEFTVVLGGPE